jgi:pimeloyl-ACP methyl ester carboxylesterase
MSESSKEKPVFTLVHGRHFDETVWEEVQKNLWEEGWRSIALSLDVEDGSVDLDEHADAVRAAQWEAGAEGFIDVGWSWGANVAIRKQDKSPIIEAILPGGAFHEASLVWSDLSPPESYHSLLYEAIEQAQISTEGLKDPEVVKKLFFSDVTSEEVVLSAMKHIRPHPRRTYEPPLQTSPRAPMTYIYLTKDQTLKKQPELARALGARIVPFESAHTPMVSRPKDFARLLINLANNSS